MKVGNHGRDCNCRCRRIYTYLQLYQYSLAPKWCSCNFICTKIMNRVSAVTFFGIVFAPGQKNYVPNKPTFECLWSHNCDSEFKSQFSSSRVQVHKKFMNILSTSASAAQLFSAFHAWFREKTEKNHNSYFLITWVRWTQLKLLGKLHFKNMK